MSTVQSDVGRQSKVVGIGIAVACVAIGYVLMTWISSSSAKQSQISSVHTTGTGTPTQESEHYAQVLDRYNREKASAAEKTGDSYLSVLSSRANTVPEQSTAQAGGQAQQQMQQQVQPQPQQQRGSYQLNQQQTKEISDQTQGLMANWAPVPHSSASVSTDGADYVKSITRVSESVQPQQASASAAVKVVEDFALAPAILDTDIDTDENSVVTANIPSGKYAGAEVFAMGYKRLTNTVDMTFTFMKWQGRSYKITAKAVDQVSMRTSLSGEVNNRYFTRIILPSIANGIGRTGQLYEQANAQNIITPQGGVIQTYPSTPNASAVAGTIVGGIANQTGQVLANDAANMPVKQVLISRGTSIGIRFIGPVLATDDLALGSTGPAQQQGVDMNALSQPASQPPRQNYQAMPQGFTPGYQPAYNAPNQYPQPGIIGYPR